MKKTTININDEEIEIDFDTFDKEEAEKMGKFLVETQNLSF